MNGIIKINRYRLSIAVCCYSEWCVWQDRSWRAFDKRLQYTFAPSLPSQINTSCIFFLSHWGRDNMAVISQTTRSNAFSWAKMLEFRFRFYWSLFLSVQLLYHSIGSDNGLAPKRRQAIIWTNGGFIWWRIYASVGLNELFYHSSSQCCLEYLVYQQNPLFGLG